MWIKLSIDIATARARAPTYIILFNERRFKRRLEVARQRHRQWFDRYEK